MEAGQLIDGVPFAVLGAQKVSKHQLVGTVLKGSQGLGVGRAEVDLRSVGVRGEDVLSLQSCRETREVKNGMQDFRGGALRDESRHELEELRYEGDRKPG